MRDLSRVVWNEGMHLAQHHFQLQSKYFEDSLHFALGHLFFKSYGVVGCELDREALRNGTVALIHARGVMPDGLAFHMPDGDPVPAPREIRELFSPTHDSHLVVLTIPSYRRDGANCVLPTNGANGNLRFIGENNVVFDETTGRDERPVMIGRKNFRLALDIELEPGVIALPLARVRRDGAGSFMYDADYVPPCLQIGASERLMETLRRMVEILDAKSDALSMGRRADRLPTGEMTGQEVATYWLLHALHSSVTPLRYQMQVRQTHPEQLYTEFSRLAGALCTFALDSHPRTLPPYDHDNLEQCFDLLERHIRAHLEIIIPTSRVQIPLEKASAYLHTGHVLDRRCFGRSRWFLGIRSAVGEAEVISRVPRLVKICSSQFILRLVEKALPGLTLEHIPIPPAAISPRIDNQYFSISKGGPCWDHMVHTGEVGVYVPDALPNPEVELIVVVES